MKSSRRWPLALIAAPAAVAVWSGWVGLGSMCGFGLVTPLPGIVPWHMDTAITLPVGVESYGAYALGAWLTPDTPQRARTFARRSSIGALALGMLGQVIYHLLAAAHAARAPWPVVVLVACLPVVTLGFGAALTHLLRANDDSQDDDVEHQLADANAGLGEALTEARAENERLRRELAEPGPESGPGAALPPVPSSAEHAAELAFRATRAVGNPLSGRQLEARFGLTRSAAAKVRQRVLAEAGDGQGDESGAEQPAA